METNGKKESARLRGPVPRGRAISDTDILLAYIGDERNPHGSKRERERINLIGCNRHMDGDVLDIGKARPAVTQFKKQKRWHPTAAMPFRPAA